jgi:uncharacterized protein YjdB
MGLTKSLVSNILPSNATNKIVAWSSTNSAVATVNTFGLVSAISPGITTIQVQTADGGFTASTVVTVTIGVQLITLNASSIALLKGNTFQAVSTIVPSNATNKTISWTSAMSNVATVSNTGLITGINNGTTIVSVFSQDGNKTASIIVRVTTPVTSVRLNQSNITLTRNTTYSLISTISPSTASNLLVSWSSSNSAIATVSSLGSVRAIAIGTAVITVQTIDGGFRAMCTITVRA